MVRTVSAREAETNARAIFDSVATDRQAVVVEREGEQIAVVVSPADYKRFADREQDDDWRLLDALAARNDDKDADEVIADVTAAVEEVRQEQHEERQRAAARGR